MAAGNLIPGDTLLTGDGSHLAVRSVSAQPITVEVFNLSMPPYYNYGVGKLGILVHNKAERLLHLGDGVTVGSGNFHRNIKQSILKKSGNFRNHVGKNPDVRVVRGEIVLRGTGPFKGKIYKTGLDAEEFFPE